MPGISLTNPESITSLTLSAVSGNKLKGAINLSKYTSIVKFDGAGNDITAISSNLSANTALEEFIFNNNKLTGDLQDFSNNSSCTHINVSNNNYDGNMTAALPTGIQTFYANNNNFERDNNATIHDLSGCTQLAVYNTIRQSDSFGVSKNTDGSAVTNSDAYKLNWSGPGTLANTSVDAADITGAIPESIRVLSLSNTNISKLSKRILLTQLYDTFKDKPTDWAKDTAVNGVTYSQPRIGVFSSHGTISKAADPPNAASPGAHHYLLGNEYGFGESSETTNAAAIAKLLDVGFTFSM